jgi:uncharacterized protein
MRITLTGATGFIGARLCDSLRHAGHELSLLTRNPRGRAGYAAWDPLAGPPAELAAPEAVVHLAGEPVAQRWSPEVKRRIRDSRVLGTRHLVQALGALPVKPRVLVAASAIGYYGDRGDEVLTEDSTPGAGFLPETCVEWEREAQAAEALGIRVVRLRIGIVLGAGGGALAQMLPPFRICAGGRLGDGRQWMSWIHLADAAGLIQWAIGNDAVAGPLNLAAPAPARNAEFTAVLARVLKRPAIFAVPTLGLKLLFGEMARVLLESQRAEPRSALAAGYSFRFPELEPALRDLLG